MYNNGGGIITPEDFYGIDNDPFIRQAINEVLFDTNLGDRISVEAKRKSLNKFGRNLAVGTSFETVAEFQGTESNETFVSTNLIDGISSSDQTNDVGLNITIEGHTIDGSGNLTFVSQDATLDGTDARTEVALSTPLARATRAFVKPSGTFNSPQAVPTGNIYIYDNTGGVAATGIPNNANQTKLILAAGETQTEKCATAISQSDYWIIRQFGAGIGDSGGSANRVTIRMQSRDIANGGVWRPLGRDIVLIVGQQNPEPYPVIPHRIVPKNHDWRIVAKSDANTAEIFAEAEGLLASING